MRVRLCHPSDFKGFYEYNEKENKFEETVQQFATDAIQLFYQYMSSVGLNATFEIQPRHGVGSLNLTTGSYDGCLGRIQRNESDLVLQMFEYPVAAENLSEGIISYDTHLTIASAYETIESTSKGQITSSFSCFTYGVWFICVLVAIIMSILIKLRGSIVRTNKRINHYSIFYTLTHLTRMHGMPAIGYTRKILFISSSIFSLVVVHYFLTLIKTELVVTKDPIVFNSYQDIIDRHAMPIFIRGMGYDEFFKKPGIQASRKHLWQYAMGKFNPEEMYIELDQMAFLLAAIAVFEQRAVIIVEHILIPIIQASGCPLRARNPVDILRVFKIIRDEKQVKRLKNFASLTPEQEEVIIKYSQRPHEPLTRPPEFNFHHSVDPSEKSFSQGLILNPRAGKRLLRALQSLAVRTIETGLTIRTRELAQSFNILGNFDLLETLAGPELSSRQSKIVECKSPHILKAEAKFSPLMVANYRILFFIAAFMILTSSSSLIIEMILANRRHA